MSPYHVTKKAAAVFFGVSVQALDGWFTRGAPAGDKRGRERIIDLAELARWRIGQASQGSELEHERTRLARAQADKTELEAARLRGELLPAERMRRELGDMIGAHRAKLLQLPSRVPELLAAETPIDAQDRLRDMVHEALQEFAELLGARARSARDSDAPALGNEG